ncbi:hypothetical protein [Streptomyces sp. Act143]|uniref:hypothetical protein n=1 Tax=Streptomyces sp. Act143 TaxID=2200760 RepID=UPI0015E80379|nr:hypothetical protein [Streptomyces sp. Act143]
MTVMEEHTVPHPPPACPVDDIVDPLDIRAVLVQALTALRARHTDPHRAAASLRH